MAEEVKKIITVEVGKSITSVRDFKKHIEDLRGALLGLNEESEEYKTIAEQITTDQAKLNEVLKVGKGNTDSAAGSYNELNNQLKALRNQYKALSETERNSTTGQAILQNITKLDTELKDIDESMGQYQRNVGNYKQAFDGAFKMIASEVGKINPTLGNLLSAVQKLVPAFKGVGTAAGAAGTSIKSAMASTGIGLLVVALGEIIAHWEEISNWASKVLGTQKDITRETKNSADAAKDYARELSEAADEYDRAMRRAGLSAEQRAKNQATIATNYRKINETNITKVQTYIKWLERLSKESKGWLGDDKTKAHNALTEFNANLNKFEDGLRHDVDELGNQINRITTIGEQILPTQIPEAARRIIKEFEKDLKYYNSLTEELTNREVSANAKLEEIQLDAIDNLRARGKQAAQAVKSEEQQLIDAYQEEVDAVIKSELELAEQNQIILNLTEEFNFKMNQLRKKRWESSDAYRNLQKDKSDFEALIKSIIEEGRTEEEVLEENHDRELYLLNKFLDQYVKKDEDRKEILLKYEQIYWQKKQAIINKNVEDIEADIEAAAKEIQDTWEKAYKKDLQAQADSEAAALHGADMMWTINPKTHESDINLEREKEDKIYEIRKEGYQRRIALYEEHLLFLEAGSEEYLDMERQITQAQMDLDDMVYQHEVELENRKREDIQRTIDKVNEAIRIAQGSVSFYGGIANEIAAYTLETAKEGTAEYKAAQITQTIVSTLSGMVGSFSQAMSLYGPTPWGFALGAAGATAMGIIGALRVNQIKNANGNSSIGSSSAGASAPGAAVSPLLNPDYDLQRITNLSLQSDAFLPGNTQVYVLESDIQEVGNRVQVREQNATF